MGAGDTPQKIKLWLNSVPNVRHTLARIIREVATGKMDTARGRGVGYLCGVMLRCWELEGERQVLEDLALIKRHLGIDENTRTITGTESDTGTA